MIRGLIRGIKYILFGSEEERKAEARAKDPRRQEPKEEYTQLINGVIYTTKSADFICAAPVVLDRYGKAHAGRQYLYRSTQGRFFFVKENDRLPEQNCITLTNPEVAAAFFAQYSPSDDPSEIQAMVELYFGNKVRLG